jgi:hypothetical protein
MDRESNGGVAVFSDVLWAEEPPGGHNKLNLAKDGVEAERFLQFCLGVNFAAVVGGGDIVQKEARPATNRGEDAFCKGGEKES